LLRLLLGHVLLLLCGPGLLLLLRGVLLLLLCGPGLLLLLRGVLLLLLLSGPGLLLLLRGVLLLLLLSGLGLLLFVLLLCGFGLLLFVLLLCGFGLLFVLVVLCTDRSSGCEKQEQDRRSNFDPWNTFHIDHLPLNREHFTGHRVSPRRDAARARCLARAAGHPTQWCSAASAASASALVRCTVPSGWFGGE